MLSRIDTSCYLVSHTNAQKARILSKKLFSAISAIVVSVTVTAGLISTSPVEAAVVPSVVPLINKGISHTSCTITATEPHYSFGLIVGSGAINCKSFSNVQVESCIQSSPNDRSWSTIQSSCQTKSYNGSNSESVGPSTGDRTSTYYRTYTFGYANGYSATVVSDAYYSR